MNRCLLCTEILVNFLTLISSFVVFICLRIERALASIFFLFDSKLQNLISLIQTQNLNLLKDLDGLICPMCPPIQIQPKASNACESILKSYPSAQIKTDLRSLDYEKDGQLGQTQSYDVMVKCSFENQGNLIMMGSANRFLSAQPKHLLAFEHLLDYLLGYDELMPLKHQSQQTAMLKQTTAQFKTSFKRLMVFGPILLLLLIQIIFHLYRYFQRSKQSKQISKNLKSKSTRDHK